MRRLFWDTLTISYPGFSIGPVSGEDWSDVMVVMVVMERGVG